MTRPHSLYDLCEQAARAALPAFRANQWPYIGAIPSEDGLLQKLTTLASHVVDQDGNYAFAETGRLYVERLVDDEDGQVEWRVFLDLGSWFPD